MHFRGSLLASLGLDSWREARLGSDGGGGSGAGAASGADLEAGLGKKEGGGVPGRAASRRAACALSAARSYSYCCAGGQGVSSRRPVQRRLPVCAHAMGSLRCILLVCPPQRERSAEGVTPAALRTQAGAGAAAGGVRAEARGARPRFAAHAARRPVPGRAACGRADQLCARPCGLPARPYSAGGMTP